MAKITLIFAALLILLGAIGYFGEPGAKEKESASSASEVSAPPKRSVTALIPAFAGILLLICGGLAFDESRRMHAMHGAVLVGLLGFLAAAGRGTMGLVKLMSDADVNRRSLLFVWLMAILCAVFVAMCVRSFIEARKRRQAEEGQAAA